MQLAHARDDDLTRLGVRVNAERRILLGELLEGDAHLLLIVLRRGFHRNGDNGIRELHRLKDDRVVLVAERIARRRVLQADCRRDITAVDDVDLLAVVRVHLENAANALLAVLRRIVDIRAGVQRAGVNTEERELSNERIRHDLKRERRERCTVRCRTVVLFARVRVHTSDRRDIRRGRHVVNDRIEQGLNALVAVRRAARHRRHLAGDGRLANGAADLLLGQLLAAEVLLHQLIIRLSACLKELVTVLCRLLLVLSRNLDLVGHLAEIVLVDDGIHLHEVDDALELILCTDRQLNRHWVRIEALTHHVHDVEEVRARDVHLVDVRHARDIVTLCLTPDRLRLRLNTAAGGQHGDRAVQHAQRALYLDRKVNVTRRINDIDAMVFPVAGRRRRRNRNAAFLFLNHPVHGGSALMNLADLVRYARVEENALGGRRLAGINVCHDADIPRFFKGIFSCHCFLSLLTLLSVTESLINPAQSSWRSFPPSHRRQILHRAPLCVRFASSIERKICAKLTSLLSAVLTTDNVRMPCWPPPSCAYLPFS